MSASEEKIEYPELTPELKRGWSLGALKYFGAGAIMASVTIGSGETLSASRGGAIFGYALMWALVASAIMKGVQVYTAARHFTLTGVHPMTHWGQIPGPKNWVPWCFAVMSIACFPFWLSGLPFMIGEIINWIFGVDSSSESFVFYARVWGTIAVIVAISLTLLQGYGFLEKVQTVIVGLLLVSMLVACIAAQPDWLAALGGLIPSIPDYEPWVAQKYPDVASVPVMVELGWYLGAIGGGTYDYLGYIGCMREKNWGLIGSKNTGVISEDPENIQRGKRWLIPAKTDVGLGFLAVLIFTICFTVLGATVLHPQEQIPSGFNLFSLQAQFLTQFHESFKYLYQVGIFMAFFGTIYGAYEIYIRTAQECLRPVSQTVRDMPERTFRHIVLAYCGIGGLALMWMAPNAVSLVKPAAIVGGVFACGLWCFAMIWADRKFLPKALRMRPVLLILTIISGTVLTVLGVQAIIAYVQDLIK